MIQSEAPSIGLDVSVIKLRDAAQIEQDVTRFASSPNGGLILTGSPLAVVHQNLVVTLAARHKLPAVYYRRYFVTSGGLISYGPDIDEQYRGAASYVNRILKGEKAADLPVQAPTKYELVINLKTAAAEQLRGRSRCARSNQRYRLSDISIPAPLRRWKTACEDFTRA